MSDRDRNSSRRRSDRSPEDQQYQQGQQQGAPVAAVYHSSSRYGGQVPANAGQQQAAAGYQRGQQPPAPQGRGAGTAGSSSRSYPAPPPQQQQPQYGQQQSQYGQQQPQYGRQQAQYGQRQHQYGEQQQQYGQQQQYSQQYHRQQQQQQYGEQQQWHQGQGGGSGGGSGAGSGAAYSGKHQPLAVAGGGYRGPGGSGGSDSRIGRAAAVGAGDRGAPGSSQGSTRGGSGGFGRGGGSRYEAYPAHAGRGPQPVSVPQQDGENRMLQVLAGSPHNYRQAQPGQLARAPPAKPAHSRLGLQARVLANLFKLEIDFKTSLWHFDVATLKGGRSSSADAAAAAAAAAASGPAGSSSAAAAAAAAAADPLSNNPKPLDNAREIMEELDRQHWKGRLDWAFDGARNLVTPSPNGLLPEKEGQVKEYRVALPGRPGRSTPFTVYIRLTKPALAMGVMARMNRLLASSIENDEPDVLQNLLSQWFERRQPLEWVLKQGLLGQGLSLQQAGNAMMEVKRALYFKSDPGNRNIGGGLRAISGLLTGARLAEDGVLFHADLTASAFLRTDINIAEWMAEVLGYSSSSSSQQGYGGRSGGRGGFGGGRGRGRGEPPQGVTPKDPRLFQWLAQRLQFDGQSFKGSSDWRKLSRAIRNKKVVYEAPSGQKITYVAIGLTDKPATHATFELTPRKSDQQREQQKVQVISVAEYCAREGKRLDHGYLPLVDVKAPKKMNKMWLPAERVRFADKQRVQAVTHRGGTELMIEAARKDPQALATGITNAVESITPARDDSSRRGSGSSSSSSSGGGEGRRLLNKFGLKLTGGMLEVEARVLPGPWLSYKEGPGKSIATNTGSSGSWNMNRLRFSEGATLHSWGVLAALPGNRNSREGAALRDWLKSLVIRFMDLGMDLGLREQGGNVDALVDEVMNSSVQWVGEHAGWSDLQAALQRAKEAACRRSRMPECQLLLCFIMQKPSPQYGMIKAICELGSMAGRGQELGVVTQVVVANKTDLLSPGRKNSRSQYQANLAMKINTKCGGTNSRWAVSGEQLLQSYFKVAQVPSIMVFGVDITHPGNDAWSRSKAAMVGSIDADYTKYAHQCWVESDAGGEMLTAERFKDAVKHLLLKHFQARNGQRPSVLLMYRDGVSDGEMLEVRRLELTAVIQACAEMGAGDGYRPRIVYVVVQKRHHVRLLKPDSSSGRLHNLDPGTVIDRGITSPHLFEFYLNSHKAIIGTSKAPRYICLLDELGFGSEGLQLFTYWLTYLYCRCTRSVSVAAPVYYAHLLAFRAKVLEDEVQGSEVDSASISSGGSGGSAGRAGRLGGTRAAINLAQELEGRMFFV